MNRSCLMDDAVKYLERPVFVALVDVNLEGCADRICMAKSNVVRSSP